MDSASEAPETCLQHKQTELLLRSDSSSLEFTAMRLEGLPSIRRIQKQRGSERTRTYTPSTCSSSNNSEHSTRAASLQKSVGFPPFVTAQSWAITDGSTGELLWGSMERERREVASLTKIMTCHVALKLMKSNPKFSLETILPVSRMAASMIGTSARLREGDELYLWDALHGMMLPSGNDAAYCIAEFFGKHLLESIGEQPPVRSAISAFVKEMNRTAKELGLDGTTYANAHGLPNCRNRSTAKDVGTLAATAMKTPAFAEIVSTLNYSCYVMQAASPYPYRKVKWTNTNRLLERGWEGVKTGVTNVAGPCLCASSHKDSSHVIVTLLGARSMDRRWVEVPKLGKWAFGKLGMDAKSL